MKRRGGKPRAVLCRGPPPTEVPTGTNISWSLCYIICISSCAIICISCTGVRSVFHGFHIAPCGVQTVAALLRRSEKNYA